MGLEVFPKSVSHGTLIFSEHQTAYIENWSNRGTHSRLKDKSEKGKVWMGKGELKGEGSLTEGQSSWTLVCPQVGKYTTVELSGWAKGRDEDEDQKGRTVHIPVGISSEAMLPSQQCVCFDREPSTGLYQSQVWLSFFEQLPVTAETKATRARVEGCFRSPSTGRLCLGLLASKRDS